MRMNQRMWMVALLFTLHCSLFVGSSSAQCGIENTAFKSGEFWLMTCISTGSSSG